MIDKRTFVREFSQLLKSVSEPRNKLLNAALKAKVLKKFVLNNPDIREQINSKRNIPIERVRFLANSVYNLITDKR